MTHPSPEPAGLTQRQARLLAALDGQVPLFMLEIRDWTFEQRKAWLDVEAITNTADVLQYGSGPRRTKDERDASIRALNALAYGLAVGAYQPGGMDFAGRHWCAEPHCGCPGRPGARCAVRCAGCTDGGDVR